MKNRWISTSLEFGYLEEIPYSINTDGSSSDNLLRSAEINLKAKEFHGVRIDFIEKFDPESWRRLAKRFWDCRSGIFLYILVFIHTKSTEKMKFEADMLLNSQRGLQSSQEFLYLDILFNQA